MADKWGWHTVVKGYSSATGNPMFPMVFPLANNPTSCFNGNNSLPPCFETEENNDPQHQQKSEYSEGLKDLFKPMFHPHYLPIFFSQNMPDSSPPSVFDTTQRFSPPPPPQPQQQVVVHQPAPAPKPKKK